jgi:hypothetical protein
VAIPGLPLAAPVREWPRGRRSLLGGAQRRANGKNSGRPMGGPVWCWIKPAIYVSTGWFRFSHCNTFETYPGGGFNRRQR